MYPLWRYACFLALLAALFHKSALAINYNNVVAVQTKKTVHEVGDHFLSLSVDPEILLQHDFSSDDIEKMQSMARAFAPAYLRIAGPWCQKYHFKSHGGHEDEYHINAGTVEGVADFLQQTGLNLIMCLNPTLRNADGSWNSTEARSLLEMLHMLDINLALEMGYERLENEPKVSGGQMGSDLHALSELLDEFPHFHKTQILAPDLNSFTYEERLKFGDIVGKAGSKISAITWHPKPIHVPGENADSESVGAMTSVAMTELANKRREIYDEMSKLSISHKPLWIGTGEVMKKQDRFIDAMVWTTKLGESAKLGADVLMQTPTLEALLTPTPEFWVSALHRELVGRKVLNAQFTCENAGRQANIFSHCSKIGVGSGGVTVFGVNYASKPLMMELHGISKSEVRFYLLTGGKGPLSRDVHLNGKSPTLPAPNWVQPIILQPHNVTTLIMPPQSIAFWEIPDAGAPGCMEPTVSALKKREIREVAGAEKKEKSAENECWWREGNTMVQIQQKQGESCFSQKTTEEIARAEEERDNYSKPEEHYFVKRQDSDDYSLSEDSIDSISEFSAESTEGRTEDADPMADGANYYLVHHSIFITGPHNAKDKPLALQIEGAGFREKRSATLEDEPVADHKVDDSLGAHKVDPRSTIIVAPGYYNHPSDRSSSEEIVGDLIYHALNSKLSNRNGGDSSSEENVLIRKISNAKNALAPPGPWGHILREKAEAAGLRNRRFSSEERDDLWSRKLDPVAGYESPQEVDQDLKRIIAVLRRCYGAESKRALVNKFAALRADSFSASSSEELDLARKIAAITGNLKDKGAAVGGNLARKLVALKGYKDDDCSSLARKIAALKDISSSSSEENLLLRKLGSLKSLASAKAAAPLAGKTLISPVYKPLVPIGGSLLKDVSASSSEENLLLRKLDSLKSLASAKAAAPLLGKTLFAPAYKPLAPLGGALLRKSAVGASNTLNLLAAKKLAALPTFPIIPKTSGSLKSKVLAAKTFSLPALKYKTPTLPKTIGLGSLKPPSIGFDFDDCIRKKIASNRLLRSLGKKRFSRENKVTPLTSLANLPVLPSVANKLQERRQVLLEKRRAKVEKIAGRVLEKQGKKQPDVDNTNGIERYQDAWPRVKGKSQHKVTGRKDLEEEEFSAAQDHGYKRETNDELTKTLLPAAENRPKREIGKTLNTHPNEIDFVLLEKKELNPIYWNDLAEKYSDDESRSEEVKIVHTPSTKTTNEILNSTSEEENDNFPMSQFLRRIFLFPLVKTANEFFCDVKKLFFPDEKC